MQRLEMKAGEKERGLGCQFPLSYAWFCSQRLCRLHQPWLPMLACLMDWALHQSGPVSGSPGPGEAQTMDCHPQLRCS